MVIRVRERREALGLSQAELATMAGVGQHTVSDIETGRHIPRVDVAIQIARALALPVEALFVVPGDGSAYPI
ncbi:helix-turn-helix transcriptional regulator [Vermiculatibacterium agrestimuris]|uniref:helix-turn-helix transcriptional regulator n=1 Tax=Vermiculatibacterium agrestimuris TaxID=2941519 RepID=UPI00203DF5F0|nr:helix-turn-helix transcriptional regulator [Vermiculatibacterium agrestimuris]